MNSIQVFSSKQELANAAALQSITQLSEAIEEYGHAAWVIAGGSTPELAYSVIAKNYLDDIDWSKVTIIIGDERIALFDSNDSNWKHANEILLRHIPQAVLHRPISSMNAETAADDYESVLNTLPKTSQNFPRFDLVWLGMGEDGHTLSLFPNHPGFTPTDRLVIPIHDSPKPPSDRVTLTLHALQGAETTIILAAGAGKAEALKVAQSPDNDLPIAQAARLTNADWLIDQDAAANL